MTTASEFIRRRSFQVQLKDGTAVKIRPVVPADRTLLEEGLALLSPQTRYRRFLQAKKKLSSAELTYLTEIDYANHFAWGALLLGDSSYGRETGIGIVRYVRPEESEELGPKSAEVALVVVDSFQRRGLGSILLWLLADTAHRHGICSFVGYASPDNLKVLAMFRRFRTKECRQNGLVRIEVGLPLPWTGAPGLLGCMQQAADGRCPG